MLVNYILLLVGTAVITAYLLIMYKKFGISKSISKTHEELAPDKVKKDLRWIFSMVMVLVGGVLMLIGNNLTADTENFPFLTVGGFFFVGVGAFSAMERLDSIKVLHYVCVVGGFTFSGLEFWINYGAWWVFAIMAVSGIVTALIMRKKQPIYWVEIILVAELLVSVLTILILKSLSWVA